MIIVNGNIWKMLIG